MKMGMKISLLQNQVDWLTFDFLFLKGFGGWKKERWKVCFRSSSQFAGSSEVIDNSNVANCDQACVWCICMYQSYLSSWPVPEEKKPQFSLTELSDTPVKAMLFQGFWGPEPLFSFRLDRPGRALGPLFSFPDFYEPLLGKPRPKNSNAKSLFGVRLITDAPSKTNIGLNLTSYVSALTKHYLLIHYTTQ